MDEQKFLAEQFESNRTHLRGVAYRMLGSLSEADDAVQEAWLRLSRADASDVDNLGGWLTTVVARVCLDMLRSRKSRREEPLGPHVPEPIAGRDGGSDPEQEALLADSVGLALLVVLETLAPAERLAFVLHDMFDLPFDEIAPIVGRSPTAARQLASRARRRVQGADTASGRRPSPSSERSSTPSWPPRAAATSRRCSRCSIPMSWSAPTMPPCALGGSREIRGAQAVAQLSWAARRPRARRWWTAPSAPWWRRADACSGARLHDRERQDRRDRRGRRPRAAPRRSTCRILDER